MFCAFEVERQFWSLRDYETKILIQPFHLFSDVMELLFDNSTQMDPGPFTAFMRTEDGFTSIATAEVGVIQNLS